MTAAVTVPLGLDSIPTMRHAARMPSPATAPDTSSWPTLTQTAARLGTNERTVRRWIESKRLRAAIRPAVGRKPLTIIDPVDVERLRVERLPPVVESIAALSILSDRLAGSSSQLEEFEYFARLIAKIQNARTPAVAAPFLTLQSAAEYSGLPKRLLAGLLRDGMLPGVRHAGEWYVKRADLDALELGREKSQ